MAIELFAPQAYLDLPIDVKEKLCNGCGTKGLGGWLVPDTLYGLNITECCDIHDFMYFVGKTNKDKESADRTFLNNMIRVIDYKSIKILKPLRRYRAMSYYSAVKDFGGVAYWSGKNKPENLTEAK